VGLGQLAKRHLELLALVEVQPRYLAAEAVAAAGQQRLIIVQLFLALAAQDQAALSLFSMWANK